MIDADTYVRVDFKIPQTELLTAKNHIVTLKEYVIARAVQELTILHGRDFEMSTLECIRHELATTGDIVVAARARMKR